LLSASIVGGLAVAAGILLLIVPGIIVALWMQLLTPVVVAENRGGVGALERARVLARGDLWRVFFVGLGLMLVVLFFNAAVFGLIGLGLASSGEDSTTPSRPADSTLEYAGMIVGVLVYTLSQSAWTPLLIITQTLLYVDLRVRKESYDLELVTETLEARAAARAAAASARHETPPATGGAMEPVQ
jgi:hypothetical protein